MLYEIMLSLRLYLSEYFPKVKDVQFMYDGVKLSELEKPFLTIDNLTSPTELLSAGRKSYRETYYFRVGVFASSFTERIKLQDAVKTALQNRISLYDENNSKTDVTFDCDVSDFTPIHNDDVANVTFDHRGYFDVSITILRDTGSKQFTQ